MKMSMLFKRKRTVRTLLPASEMSKVTAASVRYISRDKVLRSISKESKCGNRQVEIIGYISPELEEELTNAGYSVWTDTTEIDIECTKISW